LEVPHDHSGAKQSGVKVDNGLILMQDLPQLAKQWDITHHLCVCFLEDPRVKCSPEAIGAVPLGNPPS